MKQLAIVFSLIFLCVFAKAQFPTTQYMGNSKTIVKSKGAFGSDSGYVYAYSFPDTATANRGFLKNIGGITITVGNDIYMRAYQLNQWIKISVGGNIVNIYNSNGTFNSNRFIDADGHSFNIYHPSYFTVQHVTSGNLVYNENGLTLQNSGVNFNGELQINNNSGDSGQVLMSNGNGNNPSWEYVGSGVDSTAYHTVSVINDSSFVLCDLHSNCDTIVISGTDTSSLSNRINQRVKYTDTTTMLSAYQTAINTNTANIALKLNKTDTTGMRAQLIAGSNVTITGTYPTLTIASSGGSSGWGLTGNAITAGQFVGTTNNTSFRLHSNGVLRILADSIGKVFIDSIYVGRGIGTKYNNIAIGDSVLQRNTTGNGNTAIGDSALQLNTSGFDNTAFGTKALRANTTSGANTAFGSNVLTLCTGNSNTGAGYFSLSKVTSGNANTAFGSGALFNNTASDNTSVGNASMYSNTSGASNVAVGKNALFTNTTSDNNTAIGYHAIRFATGGFNTAVGASTLQNLTTGVANSCFGYGAGAGITTGSYNVIIGGQASALPVSRSNYVIINDGGGNTAFWKDSIGRAGIGTTSPNSSLSVGGSFSIAYVAKTANYTATINDYFIDCPSNSFTVTLPTAVGITGRIYVIKNSGTATVITVATTGGETIDGTTPPTLTTLVPLKVISDGANWKTF